MEISFRGQDWPSLLFACRFCLAFCTTCCSFLSSLDWQAAGGLVEARPGTPRGGHCWSRSGRHLVPDQYLQCRRPCQVRAAPRAGGQQEPCCGSRRHHSAGGHNLAAARPVPSREQGSSDPAPSSRRSTSEVIRDVYPIAGTAACGARGRSHSRHLSTQHLLIPPGLRISVKHSPRKARLAPGCLQRGHSRRF